MRLKLLTTLTTLSLVAVCLALGATLWWSERVMDQPYRLMVRYLGLSELFQKQVVSNVRGYLESGDALRHSQAILVLDELEQSLDELPQELATPLRPSLAELRAFASEDLLAAGKLAGDPQGLLVQAERELAASLTGLQRYAEEGSGYAYFPPLLAAFGQLQQLSQARQRLVASGREELVADVESALEGLRNAGETLKALPLLGVVSEQRSSASNFSALLELDDDSETKAAQDKGVALKRELANLASRYPAELKRTRDLVARRLALHAESDRHIAALQQGLDALEPAVRGEHARIQNEVRWIQASIIALILGLTLLIDRLQRRLGNVLRRLAPVMQAWSQGDFSQPVKIGSKIPELDAIEGSLTHLQAYLTRLMETLRGQVEQVSTSSRSLSGMSLNLQEGARHQAHETALIRDSLAELESTIAQVAEGADETACAGRDVAEAVRQGQQVIGQSFDGLRELVREVQQNAHAIAQLADETSTIGNVLTVIRSIAEQTNLLALNAAIEAARAGEQGRGFAVVADEVRSLARRTGSATEEIQQLVERLQQAARRSVDAMQAQVSHAEASTGQAADADDAMVRIVESINTVGSMAERIAQTTAQQLQAVSEIRGHSERIYQLGDLNMSNIDQGRQQSEQLLYLGNELDQVVQALCGRAATKVAA